MRCAISPDRLFAALDATWPAADCRRAGPFTLRRGLGGGNRVSSATAEAAFDEAGIAEAEAAMEGWRQPPLFMIREGEDGLDSALAGRGYDVIDPVVAYAADTAIPAAIDPPPLAAIPSVAPLALMREMWARNGIGAGRLAVMERAKGPKTWLFSRTDHEPVGVAFVATDGDVAMLHALTVDGARRRSGFGRALLGRAAIWAREQGAATLATVTLGTNTPARTLFETAGMDIVARYHYRIRQRG